MRVQPWQRIGTENYSQQNSAADLMRASGLDWTVSLGEVFTDYDLLLPDKYATIRNNKDGSHSPLSVVGSRYKIFQNEEVFNSLDYLVDSGEARYAAAGELAGGKIVWTVLELPESVSVKGDPHAGYLLARTSHDGSTAFELAPIVTRLNCTNQINASFRSAAKKGNKYSLRHSHGNDINIADMREVINIIYADIKEYQDIANNMLGRTFSDEEFKNFTRSMYPLPAMIEYGKDEHLSAGQRRSRARQINSRNNAWLVWSGETGTQDNIHGTMFGAWQAVIEVADHFGSDKKTQKAAEKTLTGDDIKLKSRAASLLLGV